MAPALARASEITEPVELPPTDVIRLRDGRRLAYTDWGDRFGFPIIHQHGMPGSRFDHEADTELYRSLGMRIVTPDRPGYGLSDPHPNCRLLDWPADVAELADHLGIWRFGITALSGGGIYALACAAAIPDRLTNVIVTGCPAAMQRRGAFEGMRFATRAGVWLGAHAPWLVEAVATALSGTIRRHPGFFIDRSNQDKPASDLRWLSMGSVRSGEVRNLQEAFRQGGWGYARDLRLLARPWGFPPELIQVPVELWHGDQDTVIPMSSSQYLASAIPGATLRICPGEAHMLLWNHVTEILAATEGTRC